MSAIPTPSGILLVDKEEGISSFDVLRKLKKLGITQAGHCGTLDPFATGLLIIVCGKMTKFSDYFMHQRKSYTALIQLGVKTDSGDRTGQEIQRSPFPTKTLNTDTTLFTTQTGSSLNSENLEKISALFLGERLQVPPMYSAIKKDGVPLYQMARKGIEVERTARKIEIYKMHLTLASTPDPAYPRLLLECEVSSGTYIRTLAEEISEKLGSVGHLIELRRTASSGFSIDPSLPSKDLGSQHTSYPWHPHSETKKDSWISWVEFLKKWDFLVLNDRLSRLAKNGFPGLFEDKDFQERVGLGFTKDFLILADEKKQPFRLLRKNPTTGLLDYFISFDNVPDPS